MNKSIEDRYNSFDDFWPVFLAVLEVAKQKKSTAGISKLLARQAGFVPNDQQVRQVHQRLMELPNPTALEFSLFVAARARRLPSRMLSGLSTEILTKYRVASEFPDSERPTWVDVRDWISSRITRAMSRKEDVLSVGRAMFAILSCARDQEFYNSAVLLVADQLANRPRKNESGSDDFALLLAEVLSKPKLNRRQLFLISRVTRAMRDEINTAVDQRRLAAARTRVLEEEVGKQQTELGEKDTRLEDQASKVKFLEESLASMEGELSRAKDRATGVEEHWNVVLRQKLAGVVAKLKGEIQHETREIAFCLDRSSPNAIMALERARQIDRILEQADST